MEILKKTIVRDAIINIICLTVIIGYFICFNTQINFLNPVILDRVINISSMIFLAISIIMFEIGYRNNKAKFFVNGIEFLVVAIFTLLIKHMPKVLGNTMKSYTEIGTYSFIAYYILKVAILYTKMRHDKLKSLSDIKEIVKEEPTKKATKRKNIKVEEGK
jgi:hypothetical protein